MVPPDSQSEASVIDEALLSVSSQGRLARFYAAIGRALERPDAARWVLLVSLAFMLPSLDTGLAADDYVHQLMLDA